MKCDRFVARTHRLLSRVDTKDYPGGVWTLPPTYRLKDQGLDRGLANVDVEFMKLSMGLGSAPQRVGQAHGADQPTHFERRLQSAASRSRLPSPEQAKTGTMPPDDSLRVDDHQSIHNARRDPIETGKKEAIETTESEPLRCLSSQHREAGGAAPGSPPRAKLVIGTAQCLPTRSVSAPLPWDEASTDLRQCASGIEIR
jgi:hypothetical protein